MAVQAVHSMQMAGQEVVWGGEICLRPDESLSPNPHVGIFGATREMHRSGYITNQSAARFFPLAMRSIQASSFNLRSAAKESFTTYGMFDLMRVVEVNHAEWALRDMPQFYNQLLWDGQVMYTSELRPGLPLGYGR